MVLIGLSMRKLVTSWLQAHAEGYRNNNTRAVKILNEHCGTKATLSRLSEWRKGRYTPSPTVISHMLFWTLPWALLKVGIETTQEQRDALEDLIWEIVVTNGERDINMP